MKQFDELSLLEIVDEVKDGDLIGVPADYSGVPMAVSYTHLTLPTTLSV